MKLTLNQQHVVESLFVNYINEKEQVLVSPTGSGKTFMIFDWMKRVKEYQESEKDKKVFFIFESLSEDKLVNKIFDTLEKYNIKKFFCKAYTISK